MLLQLVRGARINGAASHMRHPESEWHGGTCCMCHFSSLEILTMQDGRAIVGEFGQSGSWYFGECDAAGVICLTGGHAESGELI